MPTIDITDDHRDRIETLRAELTAAHAGEYASVETGDALRYLLDLADAVDDPDRTADPAALAAGERDAAATGERNAAATDDRRGHDRTPFDIDRIRDRLEARNRKHGDPDDAEEMDLYSIAAAFDVTGRSEMTKAALIEAILDAAERLAADPFAEVDIDLDSAGDPSEAASDPDEPSTSSEPSTSNASTDESEGSGDSADGNEAESGDDSDAGGASQLDAMMSLLDTHGDKWREGDGDARYEVDLPDGSVETARTKDDVRALLFKNY